VEQANFFDDEAATEARTKTRNRYLLTVIIRLLWAIVTAGGLLGVLLFLTIFFGWSKFVLSCLLGFLTGICLAAGIATSLRNRALITLLLGVLILPGMAGYLALLAGSDPRAFEASSAALLPYAVHATAALIGGLILVKFGRYMPVKEPTVDEGKGPVRVMPAEMKEHANHERPALDKAA
jgi:hypothetical protein